MTGRWTPNGAPGTADEPDHGARHRVRRRTQAASGGARPADWPTRSTIPITSPGSSPRASPPSPTRSTTRDPHRVVPGLGKTHGVRWPLIEAVSRGFREATRKERTSRWLFLADRLFREPELEARWFAFGLLERLVLDEPERSWQLLRRAAREAGDWITVDALAHAVGKGSLPSRTAGPSSSSSSTRHRAGNVASSAARSRPSPSSIARSGAIRRWRSRARPHRPADRRRRAGRPEGPRVGAPQPRPRRRRAVDSVLCERGRARGGNQ